MCHLGQADGCGARTPGYLLDEMLHVATLLATGFDHLRIDMYDQGDRFWVGEITVYSYSGLVPFTPDEADYWLGAAWKLHSPLRRALATMLRRPWEILPPGDTQTPPYRA